MQDCPSALSGTQLPLEQKYPISQSLWLHIVGQPGEEPSQPMCPGQLPL